MSVLNYQDLTACANKERQSGYWMRSTVFNKDGIPVPKTIWIADCSTTDCMYDRKAIDPACANAKCARIA